MVSFEAGRDIMLLADADAGVLVNVRLCTGNGAEWGRERKGIVMVIGYLERAQVSVDNLRRGRAGDGQSTADTPLASPSPSVRYHPCRRPVSGGGRADGYPRC